MKVKNRTDVCFESKKRKKNLRRGGSPKERKQRTSKKKGEKERENIRSGLLERKREREKGG